MDQADKVRRSGSLWEPALWIFALVLVLGLGFAGFMEVRLGEGQIACVETVLDCFFQTLQLLPLNSGVVDGPTPLTLQVARFVAAGFTFSLFGRAFSLLRPEVLQRFWASQCRGHVIIAGLGWRGRLFVQAYQRDRRKMVVIEKDENNPIVRELLYAQGVIVLIGDATTEKVLRDAGIFQASALLCLGDDLTNLEIANRAEQMFAHAQPAPTKRLSCYVHVGSPVIARDLREPEVTSTVPTRLSRCVFNLYEIGAALSLESQAYSPLLARHSGQAPHILLVGMGDMGETLIRELLNRWRGRRAWNPNDATRIRVTVVDPQGDEKIASLRLRVPDLDDLCDLRAHAAGQRRDLFDCCSFLFDDQGQVDASAAFLCSDMYCPDQEARALGVALRIQRRLREKRQHLAIVLQIIGNKSLETMFGGAPGHFDDIHTFSLFSATCLPDFLEGVTDRIARAIHEHYVAERLREGMQMYAKRSLCPWQELDADLRASNRDQAQNLASLLALPGRRHYRIVRAIKASPAAEPFHPDDIQEIARREHERYQRFEVASDKKTLQDSWADLSPENRQFTIKQVQAWPRILASIGFAIVPYTVTTPMAAAAFQGR